MLGSLNYDYPEATLLSDVISMRVWIIRQHGITDTPDMDDQAQYELAYIRSMAALEGGRKQEISDLMGDSEPSETQTQWEGSDNEDENNEGDEADEGEEADEGDEADDDDCAVESYSEEDDKEGKEKNKNHPRRNRYQQMIDDFDELEALAKKEAAKSESEEASKPSTAA